MKLSRTMVGALMIPVALLLTLCGTPVAEPEDPGALPESASPVYISEYMCAEQWVEIYNPQDTVINLSGYILVAGAQEHEFEVEEIPARGYILIGQLEDMENGDPIYVKDGDGALVDIIEAPLFKKNKSTTRELLPDGSFSENNTSYHTPGFPNTMEGYKAYQASLRKENTTGIVISEIMADNESAYADGNGNYMDFVELYNHSADTVDLSGWGLSDDEKHHRKYIVPDGAKILPGGYYVINCATDVKGCAPFNIRNGEEFIYLSDKEGHILEEVGPVSMQENQSMAFFPGKKSWITTFNISPGHANTYEGSVLSARESQPGLPYLSIWEAFPGDETTMGWAEIRNNREQPINLDGFSIIDDIPAENCYTFTDQELQPGEILQVKAFELRKSAGLYLRDADGNMLDCITLSDIPAGMSRGREEGGTWLLFKTPTPGEPNKDGILGRMMAPIASLPSGQYDDVDSLTVEFMGGGTIYYTTDGSVPTTSSRQYTNPIVLKNTTVIRTMAVDSLAVASPVSTWNYLVNEYHKLDVFCLTSDPDGLFSYEKGIYANGISLKGVPYPYKPANFWRKWVRQSNVSLLPKQGLGFSEECGASIFGGWTRAYTKKSMKFKFKRQYGAGKLHYKLFGTRDFSSFQSIVMRCGGQDSFSGIMRDDLTSYILDHSQGLDLDFMASRAVVVYINGKYWGIYYLREKINKHFIASHYNIPTDGMDIIMGYHNCEEGSRKDWDEFYTFAKTKDLRKPKNYKYVEEHMDLQNYADWIIAECFIGNRDAGNVRSFKSTQIDNKWRWILYDTDMGWSSSGGDGMLKYLTPQKNGLWPTAMIRSLLRNDNFRAIFLERLEYQMHNVWNKENVNAAIDFMEAQIDSEVARNNKRWSRGTYASWKENISQIRRFANGRQAYLKKQFATNPSLKPLLHMSKEELDRCFE